MRLVFNIGDVFHVKTHYDIIAVKCVADDPNENPSNICNYCIFHGNFDCFSIHCRGCHFETIKIKEVQQ